MSREPQETFDEFYESYLQAHRSRANRWMHFAAKLLAAGCLAVAVWTRNAWWLLAVPFAAVVPCWAGHWLLEHNRPTSWTEPASSILGTLSGRAGADMVGAEPHAHPRGRFYYSFAADLRMCAAMLGFRWGADLQRDGRSAT